MKVLRQHKKVATIVIDGQPQFEAIGGRWGGAGGGGALAPHFFAGGFFFTCECPPFQTKSRKQM